eukprot:2306799-Rhodomonas_salina.1
MQYHHSLLQIRSGSTGSAEASTYNAVALRYVRTVAADLIRPRSVPDIAYLIRPRSVPDMAYLPRPRSEPDMAHLIRPRSVPDMAWRAYRPVPGGLQ